MIFKGLHRVCVLSLLLFHVVHTFACEKLICCENGVFNSAANDQVPVLFNTTTLPCNRARPTLPDLETFCTQSDTPGIRDFKANVSVNNFKLSWTLDDLPVTNVTSWQCKMLFYVEYGDAVPDDRPYMCQYFAFQNSTSEIRRGEMNQNCVYNGSAAIKLQTCLFSFTRPANVGKTIALPGRQVHSHVYFHQETEPPAGTPEEEESNTTALIAGASTGTFLVITAILTITVIYVRKHRSDVILPLDPSTAQTNISNTEKQSGVRIESPTTEDSSLPITGTDHVTNENNMTASAPTARFPSFAQQMMMELNRDDSFRSQQSNLTIII